MPSLFETTTGFSVAAVPGQRIKPERAENKEANPDERKRSLMPAALSTSQRELVDDLFCGGDDSMDAFNKPTKWHREREHRVAVPVLVQHLASSTHASSA